MRTIENKSGENEKGRRCGEGEQGKIRNLLVGVTGDSLVLEMMMIKG